MAERRTRPNPIDRRHFISERTAKSLSLQASSRVYQSRSRRRFNFLDYAPISLPEPDPSDTEEDFGQPREPSVPEGVRINTDLYDAYASAHLPSDDELRQTEQEGLVSRLIADLPYPPESIEREQVTSPRPQSPPVSGFRNSFWGSTTGASSLHRSNSLRRANRSRADAFSDFTSRRRLATRQNSLGESSRHDDNADGTWDFGTSSRARPDDSTTSSAILSSAPLTYANNRRYLPISPWGTRRRFPQLDIWGPEPREPSPLGSGSSSASTPAVIQEPVAGTSTAGPQSSSQLWYSLTSGRTSPGATAPTEPRRHSTGGDIPSERRQLAPRLRRGGLRAPESLLSRYASPSMEPIGTRAPSDSAGPSTVDDSTQTVEAAVGTEDGLSAEPSITEASLSLTTGGGSARAGAEELQQLLTPRSISPSPAE